ncbi:MAG TPA: CHRD domain-containing protein [Gemmatimonadaceae bacterium]|nr:CHRD domain-containing protein [Gemmatimonadaceae bacterium]
MSTRTLKLISLAVTPFALVACEPQPAIPTGPTVVHLAVIAGADHGGRPYSTPMTQEVTSQPPYEGDSDGTGEATLTVNLGQREVCWETTVSNLDPATASHIHEAAAGIRGGIVVFLSAPDGTGHASGCTSDVDPEVIKRILKNPAGFYVNVHTTVYPAGAIRGQLDR